MNFYLALKPPLHARMFVPKIRSSVRMSLALLTRNEKRVLLCLSGFAFLLRIPLALRPVRELAGFPYADDAYYLFSIARHIALGLGPTVDGIHPTNGFQPLILLLYSPIFWLCGSNPWLAIRWTFVLNGVIATLVVWSIAILLKSLQRDRKGSNDAALIGAAIWTFSYAIFIQLTNGLETGLATLLLVLALIVFAKESAIVHRSQEDARSHQPRSPRWWLLGIALGFAVLARIDLAIFVAIIVAYLAVRGQWRGALVTGATSFLISLPWWLYNYFAFGSLMPTSGQAENIWPLPRFENLYRAVQSISDILTLIFYLPDSVSFPFRIAWLLLLAGSIFWLARRTKWISRISAEFRLEALLPLLLFSVALFCYYTFFFRAPHFLARYFQPGRLLWSLFVAMSAAMLWQSHQGRKTILAFAALMLGFSAVGYLPKFVEPMPADFYDFGLWAAQHPNEKIGMLQSGVASFVSPNVINLDGKVNTAALTAHQQGRLAEYLRQNRFDYIADLKPFVEDLASIARAGHLQFDSVGSVDHIQIMKWRKDSP